MGLMERLSNGWRISLNSFKVLKENKQLIVFPLLSGISLVLVMGSFIVGALAINGWDVPEIEEENQFLGYLFVFIFYVINYFIIVFFNTALTHCTRLYFRGEEVTIDKGLKFSMSRIGAIFTWAIFAATIGTILRIIQENFGWLGKIITGIIGVVWSIATFFVVPILAYENLGPIGAFKRSTQMMRDKWGESLAGTFSFGLIQFIAFIVLAIPLFFIGAYINIFLGIALAVLAGLLVFAIMSAAQTIFISAVYHNINGDPVKHFNEQVAENLFIVKEGK